MMIFYKNREEGFTLPSVLVIILLATTMLFGIISLLTFYNSYNIKLNNKKKLDLACFSGLQLLLTSEDAKESEKNSFNITIDSVKVNLQKSESGLFTEIESTAFGYKDSSKILYLLANESITMFNNAIIISKDRLRAAIAGNTKINGDMLLTSDKVKIGRITGVSSASKDYLDGEIIVKENIDSKLFNEQEFLNIFDDNENVSATYINESFELNQLTISRLSQTKENIIEGDLFIYGSLDNKTPGISYKLFVNGRTIFQENSICDLRLEIHSDSSIVIEESVKLNNAVLISGKEIEVKENVYGKNVQLFSQKSVTISESLFEYPAVVAVYSNTDKEINFENELAVSSSVINGSLMLICSTVGLQSNKSIITVDERSKIHGLIYSENNADISGEVSGIIYAYSFWYYKEPTEYINWLVNLNIDRNKLDKNFLLPVGFKGAEEYSILKETWIN